MVATVNVDQLRTELIRDEGVKVSAYQDSKGYWTIGVGHNVDAKVGGHLTQNQIAQILNDDIQEKIALCQSHNWYQALDTDNRRRAIINMVFNLGLGGFMKFDSFINLLVAKKWKEAAENLKGTLWYREVGDRAVRIADLIENG